MDNKTINALKNPFLWIIFIVYCITAIYSLLHHELWGDEIHSWNIAKASQNFRDLILNTRYEGHPPLWYFILWTISRFTHDPFAIQVVHSSIACLAIFLVLFYSPFSFITKLLIPFGYFFLFEYSVISRNYAIGILIAFIICFILHKDFKWKTVLYYCLLFFLSNSNLLSLLLGLSFHVYFLMLQKEQVKSTRQLIIHLFTGILVMLPAAYMIFPPADSSLNNDFWLNKWEFSQLSSIIQSPVRAFIPIPDWTEYHFWDTHFLISKGHVYSLPVWGVFIASAVLILLCIYLLRSNNKSLYFFLSNLSLIIIVSLVIPFTNARHVGFILISLIIAFWLRSMQQPPDKFRNRIINIILMFQLAGGIIAVTRDIKYPFSNGYRVTELLKEIPGEKIVSDYWCLNILAAYTDKPYYCTDTQSDQSYLFWNSGLAEALKRKDRYSNGILHFMKRESADQVYLFSTQHAEKIQRSDSNLFSLFTVRLLNKTEGAIEKGSDLYVYELIKK